MPKHPSTLASDICMYLTKNKNKEIASIAINILQSQPIKMFLHRSDSIHSHATATDRELQILSTDEALNIGARHKLVRSVDECSVRVPEEEFPDRAVADLAVGFPKEIRTIRLTPQLSVQFRLTGIQNSRSRHP